MGWLQRRMLRCQASISTVTTLSKPIDCFAYPIAHELDARGLRCPLPLLKAKQALRNMMAGQVLRVLATDAGSVRDFQSYAHLSGQELLAMEELDGVYCYLLKKSGV
ncbi:MAG: sulfurtransferase TusA family protein [Cellvibrio sp.]|jgi:tRNA 2-thiouridine synthesizing protein A|nr:sulfurtransferase TusA family protein [Cellvibrio sp.]